MGETMREKIARALHSKVNGGKLPPEDMSPPFAPTSPIGKSFAAADAVLEVLMEPTEAMLEAGDIPGWDDNVTVGLSADVFRAMIRSARDGK